MKQGDYVNYDPGYKAPENGRIKSIDGDHAFVVYHCNEDWDNYENYTGARTRIANLLRPK